MPQSFALCYSPTSRQSEWNDRFLRVTSENIMIGTTLPAFRTGWGCSSVSYLLVRAFDMLTS